METQTRYPHQVDDPTPGAPLKTCRWCGLILDTLSPSSPNAMECAQRKHIAAAALALGPCPTCGDEGSHVTEVRDGPMGPGTIIVTDFCPVESYPIELKSIETEAIARGLSTERTYAKAYDATLTVWGDDDARRTYRIAQPVHFDDKGYRDVAMTEAS